MLGRLLSRGNLARASACPVLGLRSSPAKLVVRAAYSGDAGTMTAQGNMPPQGSMPSRGKSGSPRALPSLLQGFMPLGTIDTDCCKLLLP